MGVKVTTDRARVAARIKAGAEHMIQMVAEGALTDCNEYCRIDQGQLKESSETASDVKAGVLVWDTAYARRVYYTGTPSKQPNENASLLWCEVAHDAHGQDWQKRAQDSFVKGMG
ncbi:MAG: minor capsid protein [Dysosmobacter sp.]|nr:minor capsid protein [Dysosmobacter sp.]